MAANDGAMQGGNHADPARMVRPITVQDVNLPDGDARCITCSEEGTITFMDLTGTSVTGYAVNRGENNIGVRRITAVSGTMSCWALY